MTARLKCLVPTLARAAPSGWQHDSVRGSRHQRGYGWAWEQLRLRILARDEHLCQQCLRADRVTVATQVDHITPKAAGGTDNEGNLEAVCAPCHLDKTARESRNPRGAGR